MITMIRVSIKPQRRGGFLFLNDEGQVIVMDGENVLYEIGGILEAAVGSVVIQYEIDVPDEFAAHLEAMA